MPRGGNAFDCEGGEGEGIKSKIFWPPKAAKFLGAQSSTMSAYHVLSQVF